MQEDTQRKARLLLLLHNIIQEISRQKQLRKVISMLYKMKTWIICSNKRFVNCFDHYSFINNAKRGLISKRAWSCLPPGRSSSVGVRRQGTWPPAGAQKSSASWEKTGGGETTIIRRICDMISNDLTHWKTRARRIKSPCNQKVSDRKVKASCSTICVGAVSREKAVIKKHKGFISVGCQFLLIWGKVSQIISKICSKLP